MRPVTGRAALLRRVRRVLWAMVAAAAIGSVALAVVNARRGTVPKATTATASLDQTSPLIGKHLPELDLVDLQGRPVSPEQLHGKPVLLNFWATWCIPCRAEMPDLQHEANKWGNRTSLIGVDDGEDVPTIQSFVREIGVTYTIWRDPQSQVDHKLQGPGLPYSFFLDRNGVVRRIHLGQMDRQYVDDRLKELLRS